MAGPEGRSALPVPTQFGHSVGGLVCPMRAVPSHLGHSGRWLVSGLMSVYNFVNTAGLMVVWVRLAWANAVPALPSSKSCRACSHARQRSVEGSSSQ